MSLDGCLEKSEVCVLVALAAPLAAAIATKAEQSPRKWREINFAALRHPLLMLCEIHFCRKCVKGMRRHARCKCGGGNFAATKYRMRCA